MDVNILLNLRTVGTYYKIYNKYSKIFRISCINNLDSFIGYYKLNHNSNIIETSSKENKQKKQFIVKSNKVGNQVLFIPNFDLGLYNGGFLELTYLGTTYNNDPK